MRRPDCLRGALRRGAGWGTDYPRPAPASPATGLSPLRPRRGRLRRPLSGPSVLARRADLSRAGSEHPELEGDRPCGRLVDQRPLDVDGDTAAGVKRLELARRFRRGKRPDRAANRPSSTDDVEPFGDGEDTSTGPHELQNRRRQGDWSHLGHPPRQIIPPSTQRRTTTSAELQERRMRRLATADRRR